MNTTVDGKDLRLGDVVRLYDDAYADATVKNVTNAVVTLFRPYVVTADFSYSGGVICYVGIEEIHTSINTTFVLVRKGGPLK